MSSAANGSLPPSQPNWPSLDGEHELPDNSVDAVRTGDVFTSAQKLEVEPPAEADDHRVRNIARSAIIPIGQQLPALVDRVDAVLAGGVRAGEEKLEVEPPAEADDHRGRDIARDSIVPIGQQLPALVDCVDAVFAGKILAGEEKLEVEPSAEADDRRVRDIARSPIVPIGEQLPALVDRVDAVFAGEILAGEDKLEVQPSAEADDGRVGNTGVAIGQQLAGLDGLDLNGEAAPQHGGANIDRDAVSPERLSCSECGFREQRKGSEVKLRIPQWICCLDPVDDNAFVGNIDIKLVGLK